LNNLAIEDVEGGVVFTAKVVPGSSRTKAAGLLGDMVKIKVAAVAERGKANRCLVEFLAKTLGVKTSAVSIISGLTNPVKRIKVIGVCAESLMKRLNLESGK
jgi:hypothetical protein